MTEIERKFLVQSLPYDYKNWDHNQIWQGYLAVTSDHKEVRIRKKDEHCYQTIKSGKGLSRFEIEIDISQAQFYALWPATEGRRIQKTRYIQTINNYIIELDIFEASLDGLIIAEVEFETEEESQQFHPLEWFDKEITTDESYKNRNLAQ